MSGQLVTVPAVEFSLNLIFHWRLLPLLVPYGTHRETQRLVAVVVGGVVLVKQYYRIYSVTHTSNNSIVGLLPVLVLLRYTSSPKGQRSTNVSFRIFPMET